ncbi:MAG: trigger factor [Verrucomicrobiota bacterium]
MSVTIDKLPECKAIARVELPKDTVEKERGQILTAFSKQAKIPGFRPGKVPAKVIEKRYQKEIAEELESRLIQNGVSEAVEDGKLDVLSVSDVREKFHNPDGSYSFTAELVIAPEFDLPEYKGIPVKVMPSAISDEDVDQTMEGLRAQFADYEEVEGRALEADDLAIIDYVGTIDGQPVGEVVPDAPAMYARGEDYWFRMADNQMLPGMFEALTGAEKGAEKSVTVTVPEQVKQGEIGGRIIDYAVTVKEIREQILPELNDEFASKLRKDSTLADIREDMRHRLAEERRQQNETMKTNQIIQHLNEKLEFEVPPEMLKQETQSRAQNIVSEQMQRGAQEEQLREAEQDIIQSAGAQAMLSIKASFILEQIADAEKVEVEQSEILAQVDAMAKHYKLSQKKMIEQLRKSGKLTGIHHRLRMDKTIEFLKQHAVEEEATPEESAEPSEA